MSLEKLKANWLVRTAVKGLVFGLVGVSLIAAVGVAQRIGWIQSGDAPAENASTAAESTIYTCPMHPEIRQDEAGSCPICGMPLVPVAGDASAKTQDAHAGHNHSATASADDRYICPMMCTPPSSEPGKCPVCAMDLVPATSASGGDDRSVSFDPVARRLAGIKTTKVSLEQLNGTVRSVGELAYDQTREASIAAYTGGRLEQLFVDSVGVPVTKGQKLVEIYSPDLYSAQQEYLTSVKNASRGALAGDDLSRELVQIAEEKLTELGFSKPQIEALRRTGQASARVTVDAPIGGIVVHKMANEGDYLKTGQTIFRIADLSSVWLRLELFPAEAARVREGQVVEASVNSLPGEKFTGRVLLVEPVVDAKTRTVGVRVELPNPDGVLRPGDFATAEIELPLARSGDGPLLTVPEGAILRAGGKSVAYVETDPGRFEIRNVELGPALDGRVAVMSGLSEGEEVASNGNFLIDSQMQLAGNPSLFDTSKLEGLVLADVPEFPKGPLPLEGTPRVLSGDAGDTLDRIFAAYFATRDALAKDSSPPADAATTLLTDAATLAKDESLPLVARRHLEVTASAAPKLFETDLKIVRDGFRRVSHGLLPVASRVRGPQTASTLTHFYCPMVEGGGGDWLQAGALARSELRNPYWGDAMLTCGEKVGELAADDAASVKK